MFFGTEYCNLNSAYFFSLSANVGVDDMASSKRYSNRRDTIVEVEPIKGIKDWHLVSYWATKGLLETYFFRVTGIINVMVGEHS